MKRLVSIAVLALFCLQHARAQNSPYSFFLHAWIPELGPVASAPDAEQSALLSIAEEARKGAFQSALEQSEILLKTTADPRTKYVALMFRHEVMRRQTHLAGESRDTGNDIRLALMSSAKQRGSELSSAIDIASGVGHKAQVEGIMKAEHLLESCLEMVPFYRYSKVEEQYAAETEQFAKDSKQDCSKLVDSISATGDGDRRDETTRVLLNHLVTSRLAMLLDGDIETARRELLSGAQKAIENRWAEAEVLWLLRCGDLEAAPRGSVLSFGYELNAEGGVRSDLGLLSSGAGVSSDDVAYERHDASAEKARAFYERARQLATSTWSTDESSFAIRDAYLTFLREKPSAVAFRAAGETAKAKNAPWIEVMAYTCAGLISGSRTDMELALAAAERERNFGALDSMTQIALSWARRAELDGRDAAASARLHVLASVLAGHGVEMSRASLLMTASSIDSSLSRSEAAIHDIDDAVAEEKQFLTKVRIARANAPPQAASWESLDENEISQTIGMHLEEQVAQLGKIEVTEGLIAITEKKELSKKEAHERVAVLMHQNPMVERMLEQLESGLLPQADQIDRFQRPTTCAGVLGRYHAMQAQIEGQSDPMLKIPPIIMAGRCDPALLKTAQEALSRLDPVMPVQTAVAKTRGPWSPYAQLELQQALDRSDEWLAIAERAEAGATLEQWTRGLAAALANTPAARSRASSFRYFRARALAFNGRYRQAGDLLASIQQAEPFWSYRASSGFRLDVLAARVEAETMLGHADAALLASEQERAERERSRQLATGVRVDDPASAEMAMLLRRATLNENFDRKRLEELERIMQTSDPVSKLPTMEELQSGIRSLPADTTTLVYYPLQHECAIWVIEAGRGVRLIRVPVSSGDLGRLAVQYRAKLSSDEAGWEPLSQALYSKLIAPVGPIGAGRTIAIIGSDRLGGITFDTIGPSPGSILMKTNPIVYVSSLAITSLEPAPATVANGGALVVGINGGGLSTPEAEARAVAARLGVSALTGPSATLTNVRESLAHARMVHFATHGVLEPNNPYQSYLLLADGRLEAWALFHDAASAEMIVLSACDTRRGPRPYMKQFTADESSISGLSSLAGARRILSSLWGASDEVTSSLMQKFYEEMALDPTSPAQALRRAKLAIAPEAGHPYGYANFVLTVRNPAAIRMGK
jgi:CHAT domain-containing protein